MIPQTAFVSDIRFQEELMTKIVLGINQDFADFDEIDQEALEAVAEFEQGTMTFEELRAMVGYEQAVEIQNKIHGEESEISILFDNPEDF